VTSDDFDTQVARVAALGEPIRRALYRFVVAQAEPVSRERAASGLGIAHHVAKFHLDRLEMDGLLDVEYRRPVGRRGPGAGRPTKLYRRSSRDVTVSLPERRYDLAGGILADAIAAAQDTGIPVAEALDRAAKAAGRTLGERARRTAGRRPGQAAPAALLGEVLVGNGYEPRVGPDGITLANCPFDSLAATHTRLVCGMNRNLVNGLLEALESTDDMHARLAPAAGRCCVILDKSST
jgi:predicted ArsR family transcriptional regulator